MPKQKPYFFTNKLAGIVWIMHGEVEDEEKLNDFVDMVDSIDQMKIKNQYCAKDQ